MQAHGLNRWTICAKKNPGRTRHRKIVLAASAWFAERAGMIEKLLTFLASFAIAVISGGGYLGIVLLMAIESACIPLPSEIIMPFAGYLVSIGKFDLYLAAT